MLIVQPGVQSRSQSSGSNQNNMKKSISTPSILIFLLFSLGLKGQIQTDLTNKFNDFQQTHLKEKIFVHCDKSSYLTNEIIWFKIYNTDGLIHKPLNISSVAYVELLDINNHPVEQIKIMLKDGFGMGSIYLTGSLKSGNYKFRAYTNWMKNFDPSYYYEQSLSIINPQTYAASTNETDDLAPQIQFLVEGGSLINGLESKVACKVTGAGGFGIPYHAALIKNGRDTILRFKDFKFGMSTFSFTPVVNTSYTCVFTLNGKKIVQPLPKVENHGYSVQIVDTIGNRVGIQVYGNVKTQESLYLILHNSQVVRYAEQVILNQEKKVVIIDKTKLSEGINNFTLFNSSGAPVAGRLYFNPPKKILKIHIETNHKSYETRQPITVKVNASKLNKIPQIANLSMSIYRMDSFQTKQQAHILSYLWLKSELKGEIESPNYYFEENTPDVIAARDNLMLINGWRKYQWDEVLHSGNGILKHLPEIEGHLISGKVVDKYGNGKSKVRVFFSVPGQAPKLFNTKTDEKGIFILNLKNYYGENEVVIQTNDLLDTTSSIILFNSFSEQYNKREISKFQIQDFNKNDFMSWDLNTQVQNSFYGSRLRQIFESNADTTTFYVYPTKRFVMEDYVHFPAMNEVFREFISQIYMIRESGKTDLRIASTNGLLNSRPLMILNGVPIFNMQKLMNLDPKKLKSMEIVNHKYFLNDRIEDGILNMTTHKKDMAGYEIEPNALILDFEGLQMKTDFFVPTYETTLKKNSKMPDRRTVLSWVPEFLTDIHGEKNINFYSSDQSGKYIGIVQGLTSDGYSGYTTFQFEIKK